MDHFKHLSNVQLNQPSIVTIGVFDGVHRGHQTLIAQLVGEARATNRLAVVLTLFPHPDRVIHGQTGRYYLSTPQEKADLLGALGVDVVITHPFDDTVRQMRAADFVDQLRDHLKMSSLWLTRDFALGYKREGDFAFLSAQGAEKGFDVRATDLVMSEGDHVIRSSTIREALVEGDVQTAAALLGRPYSIAGEVVHGDQRGRTIGFPTANMRVWDEQMIPANGVYAGLVTLKGERFMSVTNIGQRPTFNGTDLRIEAHLLDFDRDIYGETLRLEFIARLRGEQKFAGLDALVAQIHTDAAQGREILTPLFARSTPPPG
jgi:riboflavin kinase/FMN adenylyltransferase